MLTQYLVLAFQLKLHDKGAENLLLMYQGYKTVTGLMNKRVLFVFFYDCLSKTVLAGFTRVIRNPWPAVVAKSLCSFASFGLRPWILGSFYPHHFTSIILSTGVILYSISASTTTPKPPLPALFQTPNTTIIDSDISSHQCIITTLHYTIEHIEEV